MTPRPFLFRLIVPFAAAMALIVAVCGSVIYWGGERTARLQQIEDLDPLAAFVNHTLPAGGQMTGAERTRLTDSARVLGTRITLIDGSGRAVFDTDADAATLDNHNDRPEVVEARRAQSSRGVRFSDTLGVRSVYVARLVDPARPDGLVLRLSYPKHVWARIGTSAWVVVSGAVVPALLVTSLLWLLLQRQWITPVRRLAEAAERMAGGEWTQRVSPEGAEDVQFFSAKLNLVASQAERSLTDLRLQRADLRALLDTLPDPILVIDPQRRITLINPPAAALLEVAPERALGQMAVNVVSDEAILRLVEASFGDRLGGCPATAARLARAVHPVRGTAQPPRPAAHVPRGGHPDGRRRGGAGPARREHPERHAPDEDRLRGQRQPRVAHADRRD